MQSSNPDIVLKEITLSIGIKPRKMRMTNDINFTNLQLKKPKVQASSIQTSNDDTSKKKNWDTVTDDSESDREDFKKHKIVSRGRNS